MIFARTVARYGCVRVFSDGAREFFFGCYNFVVDGFLEFVRMET